MASSRVWPSAFSSFNFVTRFLSILSAYIIACMSFGNSTFSKGASNKLFSSFRNSTLVGGIDTIYSSMSSSKCLPPVLLLSAIFSIHSSAKSLVTYIPTLSQNLLSSSAIFIHPILTYLNLFNSMFMILRIIGFPIRRFRTIFYYKHSWGS